MPINADQTVRDLAVALPGATRVFEEMGIDYCCGGGKSLPEACEKAGIPLERVMNALEQTKTRTENESADWQSRSLTDLAGYIVKRHHEFTKAETARLQQLAAKVLSVHGKKHPELQQVNKLVEFLGNDLNSHMLKEEQVLFPRIALLEEAVQKGQAHIPSMLSQPIKVMMQEHDDAGDILRELRSATDNYAVPADACISYKTLYQALQELERDLHQHIHLENNILFPRTLSFEKAM